MVCQSYIRLLCLCVLEFGEAQYDGSITVSHCLRSAAGLIHSTCKEKAQHAPAVDGPSHCFYAVLPNVL